MATNPEKDASSEISSNASRSTSLEERVAYFYQNGHLAAEFSDKGPRRILWSQDIAIALLGHVETATLLKVDQTNSVMGTPPDSVVYSPYGHFEAGNTAGLVAFNGQRFDLTTNGYALGNGHRIYRPDLRRFCSPDTLSPFSTGGLNAYSYCADDPINNVDPSGQTLLPALKAPPSINRPKSLPPTSRSSSKPTLGEAYQQAVERALAGDSDPASPRLRKIQIEKMNLRAIKSEIKNLEIAMFKQPMNRSGKLETARNLTRISTQKSAAADAGHWNPNSNYGNNVVAMEHKTRARKYFEDNPGIQEHLNTINRYERATEKQDSILWKINKLRNS
ncbi:RHS repeat-associated core domain-containing protein [Pseudomonas sp. NPDC089743]|uniref:RHS repeat-associated core domain-containing protein n=1 Tax=Pseudomonas sp. NPDC089743 TaxID=3364471 RepID=UPI00381024BF